MLAQYLSAKAVRTRSSMVRIERCSVQRERVWKPELYLDRSSFGFVERRM